MEITDVETYALFVPADEIRSDSRYTFSDSHTIAVEIETDEGITGIGWMGATKAAGAFKRLLDDQFVPRLVGRDPFATAEIREDLRHECVYYGETGMTMYPRGAIDIALWDVKAKAAGQPLYKLLGGDDPRVKAYASSLDAHLDLDELAERHGRFADRGFTAFKTKVGDKSIDEEEDRIRTIRETVGPDADIFIDANQAWTVKETIETVNRLSEHDVGWMEEPISEWDLDGHKRVTNHIDPPLSTGEMFYRPERIQWLLEMDAMDVAQPDLIRIGGISGMLDVARLAHNHHVPLAPHANAAISAHVVSAAPTGWIVEYFTGGEASPSILEEGPDIEDGHLILPDRPGHGYRISEEARADLEVEL